MSVISKSISALGAVMFWLISGLSFASITLDQAPPTVTLSGKDGGLVSGDAWSSTSLVGKVHVLIYVDPDEQDLNKPFQDALEAAKFPKDQVQTVAVINMAATWLPDFAISAKLSSSQKRYPDVVYVEDRAKVLIKTWRLQDDSYDVVIFDKTGRVVQSKDGELTKGEIQSALDTIRTLL